MAGGMVEASLELLQSLASALLGVVLVVFSVLVWRANRVESEKNALRARSIADLWNGRLRVRGDWLPDARVREGMVYSEKHNRIEIQGGLSDEALRKTFGQH